MTDEPTTCTGSNSTGKFTRTVPCQETATDGPYCGKHAGIIKRQATMKRKRHEREDAEMAKYMKESAVADPLVDLHFDSARADGNGRIILDLEDAYSHRALQSISLTKGRLR